MTQISHKNVVLITGCSSGFGYLSAMLFAENGWKVYGTLRDITTPAAIELQERGISTLQMDITQSSDIQKVVKLIISESKHIDVLVNNAGAGFLGPVEDFSTEEIQAQFAVNLFGVHQLIKEVLPYFRAQNSGKIINISSMGGRSTTALYGVYSATKYALEALSEALNFEVSKWNISVSLVEPGSFATKFGSNVKMPKAADSHSPYNELLQFNKGMRNGLDNKRTFLDYFRNPQRVANLILRIAHTKNPKLRYPIGFDAIGIILATTFIPYNVRLFILRLAYRWK